MPDLTLWTAREILRMKRDLDTLFSSLCQDFGTCGLPGSFAGPSIDIFQQGDTLIITAKLPGVDPKDLLVSLQDDKLILTYDERGFAGEDGTTIESQRRSSHTIRLPCRVDAEKAEAVFESDALNITLPMCKQSVPKPLHIKIG